MRNNKTISIIIAIDSWVETNLGFAFRRNFTLLFVYYSEE